MWRREERSPWLFWGLGAVMVLGLSWVFFPEKHLEKSTAQPMYTQLSPEEWTQLETLLDQHSASLKGVTPSAPDNDPAPFWARQLQDEQREGWRALSSDVMARFDHLTARVEKLEAALVQARADPIKVPSQALSPADQQRQLLQSLLAYNPTLESAAAEGCTNSTVLAQYASRTRQLNVVMRNALDVLLGSELESTVFRRHTPPNAAPKLLVVSACTKDLVPLYCDLSAEAMDEYAASYGFDYIQVQRKAGEGNTMACPSFNQNTKLGRTTHPPTFAQIRADLDPERLNPWIKILVLRLLLERNPLVLWIDADVIVRDQDWNLPAFLDEHMPPDVAVLGADDMVSTFLQPNRDSKRDDLNSRDLPLLRACCYNWSFDVGIAPHFCGTTFLAWAIDAAGLSKHFLLGLAIYHAQFSLFGAPLHHWSAFALALARFLSSSTLAIDPDDCINTHGEPR
ncbi:uncharacterized protein MONBRDRAFT_5955 [Monosiga brevicollis MX1]|uniref:Uncharacterized protein n=1 Tax=Monosiga brevicollis TaxID=81824 RepID=A9UR61_MONBE|nr:uncharacterized protein MONBRDRAFT_5955 [Monosiga brevicollis MX1]EDQ91863.1 predicted protein [Monosiga brevicollis MX1]|eukprot:XP_001743149.1 hypothetical protein [Monosiga brevicollis MX1]